VVIPRECDDCIRSEGELQRADFHGEKKLREEDREWVLPYSLTMEGKEKGEKWIRIQAEDPDWRE
jgi:hypothetical protein